MNLLLTACGCPGASTLIRYLRKAYNHEIYIVGVDARDNVIGKILSDEFYIVPHGDSDNYIQTILTIIEKENIDVVLPESTVETVVLSKMKQKIIEAGATPIVSDFEQLQIVRNKHKLYETLKGVVPLPEYRLANSLEEFNAFVFELGYPPKKVCFKPPVSEGSRGFRILNPEIDRAKALLYEKPNNLYITLEEINEIFKDRYFSPLLVMEYVEGEQLDAMTLAFGGEALLTTVKTRERERNGVITHGEVVKRPETVKLVSKIINKIPLSYSVGLQFIQNKLIEINPRVSTFMYQDDLIEIYYAIELARGRKSKEEVKELDKKIRYGRKMIRYMDQVFFGA